MSLSRFAKLILLSSLASPGLVDCKSFIESWIPESQIKFDKSTPLSPQEFCDGLKENQAVQCGVVGFPDGQTFIVIDKKEDSARTTAFYEEHPVKACDNDFADGHEALMRDYFAAFKTPSTATERIAIASSKLQNYAFLHRPKLIVYLSYENCPRTRRAAAELVKYTPDCVVQAGSLVSYISDIEQLVRNGIGQCMNRAVQFQDSALRLRIVDAAFSQLALPNHSDRNKAIATIQMAMGGNEIVRNHVREKYLVRLEEIAQISVLPNVGGLAKAILKSLLATPTGESKQ